MKKTVFTIFIGLFILTRLQAQTTSPEEQKGKNQAVGFGINIPAGVFSESHIAGLSGSYSWSARRFGKLNVLPKKLIGFTADGGIDYYFGKRITVAGYDFKYGGYFYVHAFGGAIYNPSKKSNISLTAGPAMGMYKGNVNAGFGVKLSGSYYSTDRLAITPGIMYMKHALVNTMWSGMLKATYNF